MASFEHVQELLRAIGPAMEFAAVEEFTKSSSWALVADEDTVIAADFDQEQDTLLLSADVGMPPDDKRCDTYELLLRFNLHTLDTGGLRMALDSPRGRSPGGGVVQMLELPVTGLDLTRLHLALVNFLERLAAWRAVVDDGVGPASQSSTNDTAGDVWRSDSMLKV